MCITQVFTRYGKCYTFNAGGDGQPPLITTKGGMGNGLELMLDIQQDEYLPVWGETGGYPSHLNTLSICTVVCVSINTLLCENKMQSSWVWLLEKHLLTTCLCSFHAHPSLQMRLRLKPESKFRSTARKSRPLLTSLDSGWHPASKHLFLAKSKGYLLLHVTVFFSFFANKSSSVFTFLCLFSQLGSLSLSLLT